MVLYLQYKYTHTHCDSDIIMKPLSNWICITYDFFHLIHVYAKRIGYQLLSSLYFCQYCSWLTLFRSLHQYNIHKSDSNDWEHSIALNFVLRQFTSQVFVSIWLNISITTMPMASMKSFGIETFWLHSMCWTLMQFQ